MTSRIANWLIAPAPTAVWLAMPALVVLLLFVALTFVPTSRSALQEPKGRSSATAQRIVVIAPNSAETICALGACDRIVGVSKFCTFPPQLLEKPRIGGLYDPDLERIVALRPDLLVLRGRSEALVALAEKRGIAIYLDETDTLDGVVKTARDLGRVLDLEEQGEHVARHFELRLQAIAERTKGRTRPRVFVTISRSPDRKSDILTAGGPSFVSEMIHIAGGENIFADTEIAYPQVSLETIIARRPDIVLELQTESKFDDEHSRRLMELWTAPGGLFFAVRPRILTLYDERALIPSPHYVEFINSVSLQFHPEKPLLIPPEPSIE